MKIIHTSDWHLGQHFMGKSRQPEHQQFLNWLINTAVEQQVGVIIVAGDIFDTGSPPSYARELYNQFIVNLRATGIHLIILGGNHDSVATLGESKALLACLNSHVIPGAMADINDQVIILEKRQVSTYDVSTDDIVTHMEADAKAGATQEPIAIICAIPFLRPRDIIQSIAGQSGSEKQQSLQQAVSDHYQSIYALATKKREALGIDLPIIATGHLTTVGAKTSESVRDIYIGTLDAFPSTAFPAADYIALGHIHRPQKVAGSEHIRYSGSPIPLSFDELNNDKCILIAEFTGSELLEVTSHVVPCFQPMQLIKGDLASIESQIERLAIEYEQISTNKELNKGSVNQNQTAWLDIEVNTQDFLNDLQHRIQMLVKDRPLEVLLLRRARKQKKQSIQRDTTESLHELTPKEVFERRLELEDWPDQDQSAIRIRLNRAFDEVVDELTNYKPADNENIKNQSIKKDTAKDSKAKDSKVKDSKVKDSKVKDSKVKDSKAKDSKAKDSKLEDGTLKNSTLKKSTIQISEADT